MTKSKRWVNVVLTGALILCGLVFGLVTCEIGLRIAGVEYRLFETLDKDTGWISRPGVSGWYRLEGESYIQINTEGFRDREHTKAKPEDTLRIALLGDSFVAAHEVPLEEGFAAVIERELSECQALAGRKVEVVKFGIPGYGTDQELIVLREKVWNYSPDLVMLAFYTSNDVANNFRYINEQLYPNMELLKPYFIFSDGHLVLDTSFVNTDYYRWMQSWWYKIYERSVEYSRLLQVLSKVKHIFLQSFIEPVTQLTTYAKPMFNDEVYKQPTDPAWQEAWQVTEELIKLMHNEVIAKGVNFLVVTLSNEMQVHPDPALRQKFMQNIGVTDLFYPDRRIKALGEHEGFKVLNLAPTFQAYSEKNKVCLHGFKNAVPCGGHWNAQGHQLAGKMIAKKLCEEQITRGSYSQVNSEVKQGSK